MKKLVALLLALALALAIAPTALAAEGPPTSITPAIEALVPMDAALDTMTAATFKDKIEVVPVFGRTDTAITDTKAYATGKAGTEMALSCTEGPMGAQAKWTISHGSTAKTMAPATTRDLLDGRFTGAAQIAAAPRAPGLA